MANLARHNFKPNLLCIAPPYGTRAPAGSGYLLGYLKSKGCHEFDFLDLRLGAPFDFTPTYRTSGVFGESYVLDIPDLPLVLLLLKAYESGDPLQPERTQLFEKYCLERGISPHYLESYLACLNRYYERCFAQLGDLEIVGLSTWTPNFYSTLMAAAHLKRRKKPPVIIAGGPQVSASSASADLGLLSGLFDAVVVGEGEEALYELYSAYQHDKRVPRGIPGIKTLGSSDGSMQYEVRRQMRMEAIPTPSFDEMPLLAYQNEKDYCSLPYQLSRGCTDKCSFCSEWVFWKHYRSDSPDHAVGQIRELIDRYGANFIEFSDSLLNGHPRRLVAFAEQILKEGIQFGWTSFMRAQMDPQTARLIKRSGCTGVFVGIESFSDEALALMNKRRTEAENIQAVCAFVEAGIHVTAGFIPGFPGDSRRGFMHSVEVLRDLQYRYPGRIELHEEPFTVMANAPMIANLESVGLEPKLWSPEYYEFSPRYAEVAKNVLCSVEGSAQGMERLGRMKLIGAIKTDAPVKGTFDEGYDDVISLQTFEFEHVHGGWHLASKKSDAGHRFSLIVNDKEREELLELQEEYFPLDPPNETVLRKLHELTAHHLVSISMEIPKVVISLYRRRVTEDCMFTVSPFIVAREMGWPQENQILIVDTVSGRSHRRSGSERLLLQGLAGRLHCLESLWKEVISGERFFDRPSLVETVNSLLAIGVLVVCDATPIVDAPECDPHPAQITVER